MQVLLDGSANLPGGYGATLLSALLSLVLVCALAWFLLRLAGQRGWASFGPKARRIEVLERVAIDPRRTLFLVSVGERVFLLGAGDGASPTLIAELDRDALPEIASDNAGSRFSEVLARIVSGRGVDRGP